MPAGSRRARSQRQALRTGLDVIAGQHWYANRARNYAAIWHRLVLSADWRDLTTRPGHLSIAAVIPGNLGTPLSADTVGRAVAWFQSVGLLGLVTGGSTYGRAGNAAAVYVLAIPKRSRPARSQLTRFADPSGTGGALRTYPARARSSPGDLKSQVKSRGDRPAAGLIPATLKSFRTGSRRAKNRIKATGVALDLAGRVAMLQLISDRHARSIVRPFALAGWTGADIEQALNARPDGRTWTYTGAVRDVPGWLAWRLSRWLDPDGAPMASPSQVRARAHVQLLAEQAARRDQLATTTAAGPNEAYLAARAAHPLLVSRPASGRAGHGATSAHRPGPQS